MKSSLASTIASIRGQTFLKAGMMTSLSILASLSNSLHMKYSKGFQSSELGGQISLGQWSFRLTFRQAWVILIVWTGLCPAGTRRDILRQQSPSRASSGCQGPLCTAWCWPPQSHLKEVGEHDAALAWDDPTGPCRRLKILCCFRAGVTSASPISWFWFKTVFKR